MKFETLYKKLDLTNYNKYSYVAIYNDFIKLFNENVHELNDYTIKSFRWNAQQEQFNKTMTKKDFLKNVYDALTQEVYNG